MYSCGTPVSDQQLPYRLYSSLHSLRDWICARAICRRATSCLKLSTTVSTKVTVYPPPCLKSSLSCQSSCEDTARPQLLSQYSHCLCLCLPASPYRRVLLHSPRRLSAASPAPSPLNPRLHLTHHASGRYRRPQVPGVPAERQDRRPHLLAAAGGGRQDAAALLAAQHQGPAAGVRDALRPRPQHVRQNQRYVTERVTRTVHCHNQSQGHGHVTATGAVIYLARFFVLG